MIMLIIILIIVIVIIVIVLIIIIILVIVILVIVILVILVIVISNFSNSFENNVYVDSSVCEKVFNFLLGGRSINNNTREWKDLLKCQMKSGAYSDTPFLVVTAALLQSIIPTAIGQEWSLFNRFKSNSTTTKSVNAEETVRQASRASATNEDHNFVS